MGGAQCVGAIQIDRMTEQTGGDDCAGARRDGRLDGVEIHVEVIGTAVDEHRHIAAGDDGMGHHHAGIGRTDHFPAAAEQALQRDAEGGASIGESDGVALPHAGGEGLLVARHVVMARPAQRRRHLRHAEFRANAWDHASSPRCQ